VTEKPTTQAAYVAALAPDRQGIAHRMRAIVHETARDATEAIRRRTARCIPTAHPREGSTS
jgi:hypothetical protein